ncbi:o-succinylbenzoate--CoA ligase [Macrococcoides canis]|uniref:2-succinylbenzoate--CoA ligase n=2 Tax=Macrococcoides canis TaxID=1855823 RepID=A0A4R6C8H2_9STAP|nr:o-succinylbenzoate--CoA ligase [Macrococcus canis]TDM23911.1 o-succinylbenzoate--CoA ligase [Macrococcus canis]TDM38654.1 o-succinylbenzoate--CoA ligase [Macrococcus canis]
MMVMEWLKESALVAPDKTAIIYNDKAITYLSLYQHALKVAYALHRYNRIALMAENTLDNVYMIHGAMLAGTEIVMINKHLTAAEVARQMKSVQVDTLFTTKEINIEAVNTNTFVNDALRATTTYSPVQNNKDDILSIMFTSGTTGVQKAVPQTYGNHEASAALCKETFTYSSHSVWLDTLPLFHISGLSILLRAVMDHCTIVLHDGFHEQQIINDLNTYKVTHLSLVPQTLERLLRHGLEPYYLQGILIGGAKLDERILTQALKRNIPIYTSFGMTETCSQMITATPDDILQARNSVGRVNDNFRLFDCVNGIGEIGVRGEHVMHGYLYPESAYEDTFRDGFFMTGDIGYIQDGYLYILDRRKDLIISGGENIYPSEIEQVILNNTEVHAIAVIPKSDAQWGQVPVCVYEADEDLDKAIINVLYDRLAKYKHPKQFVRTDALIRTSNGKVSRHKVKEWFDEMY